MTTDTDAPGPTTKEVHQGDDEIGGQPHATPAKSKTPDPTKTGAGGPSTPPTVESAASAASSDGSPPLAPRRLDPELAAGGPDGDGRAMPAAAADASEIDALIQQLDEVESDFNIKLEAAETTIREKDAIIGALGHNLSELKAENGRLRQDLHLQRNVLEMTQQDLDRSNGQLRKVTAEMAQQTKEHESLLKKEVGRLEAKAKQVEKDVVSQAQGQFAQAKRAYDALVAQRDELLLDRSDLSKRLHAAADEAKKGEAKAKTTEADLRATIASLQAEVAAADARAISLQRDQRVATEEAEGRIRVLEEALGRCETERMDLKKGSSLAAARTSEEQRLVKENAELNALCEELMAMVEGKNGGK